MVDPVSIPTPKFSFLGEVLFKFKYLFGSQFSCNVNYWNIGKVTFKNYC